MRVHHLDCCPMRPYTERFIQGEGSWGKPGRMVAHCLLIETEGGLVLVDTGLGIDDVRAPLERLGRLFLLATRPRLDEANTALRQVEALGFRGSDVRHIVLTHLDVDHAGGLADFPAAKVHVYDAEHRAAMHPRTRMEAERYRPAQWAHEPDWQRHDDDGEAFEGLVAVRAIVEPDVLLVPTIGHSRGHAAVAVRTGDGWLLHCGDAYFHHDEMRDPPTCPPGLRLFQRIVAVDNVSRLHNQRKLRELRAHTEGRVQVFSAHDALELSALRRP